ncbi:MAG: hypothetical protein MH204_08350, partial [Fimbriimonadaceae bacterium]|nr:hypothetical protein [Fimbriimonadaceae bacterium]
HYLGAGLVAVLLFVGGKMVYTYYMHTWGGAPAYKFPIGMSLGIILGILAVSVVASLLRPKGPGSSPPAAQLPG